jgi:MFS family permease
MGALRHRTFAALWIAQFVSNTGTWAQTVGAQWLMGDLGGGPLLVALVQTASSLPVFLLVLPAGALGDILDRRRLLLVAQSVMLAGAVLLTALTASDTVTPGLLLGAVGLIGAGQALAVPSFQAVQPELVPRDLIPSAALLNGVNFNVSRAVGPAIGGVLIAAVGPAATFALNAASFLAVVAVLVSWRRPPDDRSLGAEHIGGAIRAGVRYVRSAPAFRRVLRRSLAFTVFASSLWALLPVVARSGLELGAGGYGLLLGSVGVGAVGGAFVLPRLRDRLGPNRLVMLATGLFAAAAAVVGLVDAVVPVVVALMGAGLAWIAVLSTLNASAQVLLPNWTRARGLASYTLVFMGAQALGSVVWGVVADATTVRTAFTIAAAGLVAGLPLGARRLRLDASGVDVRPATHWPEPHVVLDPEPAAGPVLVTLEWRVTDDRKEAFLDAVRPLGRSRRRTGATRWGIFEDAATPGTYVETFLVATWEEHLRQHLERGTVGDEAIEDRVRALSEDGSPTVRHLVWAYARVT